MAGEPEEEEEEEVEAPKLHLVPRLICAVLHVVAMVGTTLTLLPLLRERQASVCYYTALKCWLLAFGIELLSKYVWRGTKDWRGLVLDDACPTMLFILFFLPCAMVPLVCASPFLASLYFLVAVVTEEPYLFRVLPKSLQMQLTKCANDLEIQKWAAFQLRADMEVALACLLLGLMLVRPRLIFLAFLACNFLRLRYIVSPHTQKTFSRIDATGTKIAQTADSEWVWVRIRVFFSGLVKPKEQGGRGFWSGLRHLLLGDDEEEDGQKEKTT